MPQLSFSEARRLSIKKWKMHVDAGGYCGFIDIEKDLSSIMNLCGFCERWYLCCDKCEFGRVAGICQSHGYSDLYSKWISCTSLENAQAILTVIENLEE